jgi:type II secretion system protein H
MSASHRLHIDRARKGFTVLETLVVLVIVAMMASAVIPTANRAIGHSRVQNTANVIASDLQLAFSLASRQRAPLRLIVDASGRTYSIQTRTGTIIKQRTIGDNSDLHVNAMTASVSQLEIFPNGLASGPITIRVGINGYAQTITMTRAGQVRVTS